MRRLDVAISHLNENMDAISVGLRAALWLFAKCFRFLTKVLDPMKTPRACISIFSQTNSRNLRSLKNEIMVELPCFDRHLAPVTL